VTQCPYCFRDVSPRAGLNLCPACRKYFQVRTEVWGKCYGGTVIMPDGEQFTIKGGHLSMPVAMPANEG
jgi:hypothetical protein